MRDSTSTGSVSINVPSARTRANRTLSWSMEKSSQASRKPWPSLAAETSAIAGRVVAGTGPVTPPAPSTIPYSMPGTPAPHGFHATSVDTPFETVAGTYPAAVPKPSLPTTLGAPTRASAWTASVAPNVAPPSTASGAARSTVPEYEPGASAVASIWSASGAGPLPDDGVATSHGGAAIDHATAASVVKRKLPGLPGTTGDVPANACHSVTCGGVSRVVTGGSANMLAASRRPYPKSGFRRSPS